jgi:hypothetical protein
MKIKNNLFRNIAIIVTVVFFLALSGYDFGNNDNKPVTERTFAVDDRCGTMEFNELQMQRYPEFRINRQKIEEFTKNYISKDNPTQATIPVIFHVIYNTQEQNITEAQIQSQLTVMNQDFNKSNADTALVPGPFKPLTANVQIMFCLAQRDPNGQPTTGITRTQTAKASFGGSSDTSIYYTSLGGKDIWDRDKYLNIYVCNLQGTLLGYAQFPGGRASTDGCVIGYKYLGTTGTAQPPNDKGRTVTHEVGHWFNLFHIWGDEPACDQDDEVADTPLQGPENSGCPTFPKTDACTPNAPGVMYMNYMDYSDDACMFMFSLGQSTRMNAALAGPRASLLTSGACNPIGIEPNGSEIPNSFKLYQNYPNPFNPVTSIKFDITKSEFMKVAVYDVLGNEITVLLEENLKPGTYSVQFDASNIPSGAYFYKIQSESFSAVKKMVVLK